MQSTNRGNIRCPVDQDKQVMILCDAIKNETLSLTDQNVHMMFP